VNSINAAGWTPLHDAVERGEVGVVAALLAAGADPDCVIPGGKRAGMSARDMGLAKVIVAGSVADLNPDPSDPYVLDLLDPDPLVRGMDPDPDPSII
jgi:ankyrin repeat protein